jgi:Tol biopolymer transport system component
MNGRINMTIIKQLCIFILVGLILVSCDKGPTDPGPEPVIDNDLILFYTRDMNSSLSSIYSADLEGDHLTLRAKGPCSYPLWYNDKQSILYLNHESLDLVTQNLENPYALDSLLHVKKNMIFPRYSKALDCLVFSHRDNGVSQIAQLDLKTLSINNIGVALKDRVNPVCSQIDNWIYYAEHNGTSYDIYRMKNDGLNPEIILADPHFNYNTFSVSANGDLLVTPKYLQSTDKTEYESYIVVYDLKNRFVLHEIPFAGKGIALYSSFTYDNKYIFFINGYPYDFSQPRNIFRVDIDGKNMDQITFFENQLAIRPLAW